MVFSSLLFLFRFLPLVLVLYFVSPKKLRNFILFVASLVFYAWGEPIYVGLMIFSTVVDYTHGRFVEYYKEQGNLKAARRFVISSMIINLGLLGFFKYTDFFIKNLNGIFGLELPLLHLALPIGISFYTFQTMSYTIDVYRGEAKAQKNVITFGTYVALFPQLIAGPIVQYHTIAKELNERKETISDFSHGVLRFTIGLGKKVLLANNIGLLYETITAYPQQELTVLMAWLGAIAFTFQIYFDFSGYSDMAIGLGRMFGFHFPENFNYPYQAASITEFWRRWHISLSSWFRDYVYIPLGGNRCKKGNQIRNILVVWALTGFWHGASWNFLCWGLYFGVLLLIEKFVLASWIKKLPKAAGILYTMFLVVISWVIFAFEDFSVMAGYLRAMFGMNGNGFLDGKTMYLFTSYLFVLVLLVAACTSIPKQMVQKLEEKMQQTVVSQWIGVFFQLAFLFAVLGLSLAYLVSASYNPFLYFRF